jgi:hypothetical protein
VGGGWIVVSVGTMTKAIIWLFMLSATGCAATVGTSGAIYVPRDAAATCAAHCHEVGLALSSVVIMANNVGCVCSAAATADNGAAAGGLAALMMQQQQHQASQAHH